MTKQITIAGYASYTLTSINKTNMGQYQWSLDTEPAVISVYRHNRMLASDGNVVPK